VCQVTYRKVTSGSTGADLPSFLGHLQIKLGPLSTSIRYRMAFSQPNL
jgi:hypothetical protein